MNHLHLPRGLVLALTLAALGGCTVKKAPAPVAKASGSTVAVTFTDVAAEAGVNFQHNTGAFGEYWMPESLGSGCAFLDYDNDGRQDIFLVNSTDWPGHVKKQTTCRLYHNLGGGRFEDVTAAAGLDKPLYGMGVAVGDYDNDGYDDLYLTTLGPNRLYRNLGNGKFQNVSAGSGLADPDWSTSAVWLDYDRDGLLDLFVGNYIRWTPEGNITANILNEPTYSTPQEYQGVASRLYRNLGGGKFADVTKAAGVGTATKALGAILCDYDDDGWPDIAVACDTQPDRLYHNLKNGKFTEVGETAGIAYNTAGKALAGMGVDAGAFDGGDRAGFVIGNFANEMIGLYRNDTTGDNAFFQDVAQNGSVGRASQLFLSFGVFFFDYDNDGWLDLFASTGHIKPQIEQLEGTVGYRERALLFHNEGGGDFREVGRESGPAFAVKQVHRGSAFGDYDDDGDLDVLLNVSDGPARLLRNDGGNAHHWVRLVLQGVKSNRDAYGARVIATVGGRKLTRQVRSARSYLSQSERVLTLGLGDAEQVDSLEVRWPNGESQTFENLTAGQRHLLVEGQPKSLPIPFR